MKALWLAVRAAFGFCAAGAYMVIESWLNDRATNENRGRILSAYIAVNLGSIMLGQWLLPIASPRGPQLFSLAAVLYAIFFRLQGEGSVQERLEIPGESETAAVS